MTHKLVSLVRLASVAGSVPVSWLLFRYLQAGRETDQNESTSAQGRAVKVPSSGSNGESP